MLMWVHGTVVSYGGPKLPSGGVNFTVTFWKMITGDPVTPGGMMTDVTTTVLPDGIERVLKCAGGRQT